MWLLYLTICTSINVLGIETQDCIVVTPASYISYSLCKAAGLDYIELFTNPSEPKTVTFSCEKELT